MCRLFGFRSVLQSGVHRSLLSADNALGAQSEFHPDGWGVAYYIGGAPHLIRSDGQALHDRLFERVSGIASSQTVVAHIRRATQGTRSPMNSHPFQYGPWIFAHNGNIKDFAQHKEAIRAQIAPELRRFILGDTDSEHLFYLFLTQLQRHGALFDRDLPPLAAADAMLETIHTVTAIVGPYSTDDNAPPTETFLTCVATNGEVMLAHQGGKDLLYSTHKAHCPERDCCPHLSSNCERPAVMGEAVNHLIFTSESLQGENLWTRMAPGQIIAVDREMRLQNYGQHLLNAMMI